MAHPIDVIILAAGQGTRMRSALPKVLHPIAGRPMLEHVYDAARRLDPASIHVVYGHGGEQVPAALAHLDVRWVEQSEQLGTGHAVAQVVPKLSPGRTVLVLYGDVPLIRSDTLQALVDGATRSPLALLTVELPEPTGYGRILRDAEGRVTGVVEEKDATAEQRAITEINTGLLAADADHLTRWVEGLDNRNAQQEYYLTDIFAMAVNEGLTIEPVLAADPAEVAGVNDRLQLAEAERRFQRRQAEALMRDGLSLADPARFDLRGQLQVGQDVFIDANVLIEGEVRLGDRVRIGPNSVLRDTTIGDDVTVREMCVLEQAVVGAGAQVGPFARLRPGTELAEQARVGNFVEIKNSQVGRGSKINHLSYVGDSSVGAEVNIGAGTITCNYDGANKHRTVIGDRAFIGSDTQLVAPVEVGADATIGAGSTVTRDAPPGQLTLTRAPQKSIAGWRRPQKKK
jgi:bifunctional UDP-N-acetylglucosamine pyrophosphorylase/glucosamine-1-phosphate N-acetyltransferase